MNSSLDAILATGTEAIGAYSTSGYGVGGAIPMETERRRSSAPSGAVGLATQQDQPTAESASAAVSGTAVPLFDSFHHAIAQETQGVTTTPASPTHPTSLAYHHHQPNHPSPSPDLLYSSSISSPSPNTTTTMSVTCLKHDSPSTSNSTTSSTTKRTAPDEYAEGSSSRSSKKNRKSRMVGVAGEDDKADRPPVAAEKQQVLSPSSKLVHQKEEAKQSASQPPSSANKPPAPPRSPSPPHDHKPAVPSPLCPPSMSSPCIPSRPTLTRRRSRGSEIALLKFALDPWLRLSRSLDGSKAVAGPGSKQAFNPATFPSTGNLRDLRTPRSCASSLSSDFGNSCGGFELSLPFNFGGATSDITFGFGNGDLAGGVKWNLVDA
ncbi:hypothetical protein FRC01_001823 [Tulasnella sp. 417]|nr:hypothetical protein FRC01_001823 [Tulasnella sp. 417]